MTIMTNKDFTEKCKWLASLPTYYYSGGNDWAKWNSSRQAYQFDCVMAIKSIIWGFQDLKQNGWARNNVAYESNGLPDTTCWNIYANYCNHQSTDFNNIQAGEYLTMSNTSHAGVYLGNGQVFECTTGWGVNKCVISQIDNNGNRIYNGQYNSYKWTHHGRLNMIDYIEDKPIELKYKNGDKVVANGYIYADSKGNGRGINLTNYIATITMTWKENGTTKPYNLDNGLGWIAEEDLQLYIEPIEKPQEMPHESEKPQESTNIPDNTKTTENALNEQKKEGNLVNNKKNISFIERLIDILIKFISNLFNK